MHLTVYLTSGPRKSSKFIKMDSKFSRKYFPTQDYLTLLFPSIIMSAGLLHTWKGSKGEKNQK